MEATRAVLEEVQAFRAAVEETEYAKAVEIMTRLIARDPKRAPFFASRAKANVLLGRMDEALKDSTQALQRDGKLALAHLCKGCALVGLGRHTGNAAQLKSGGRALQQARTLDKTIASQDLFKRFEAALSDQMARNFVVKGAVHQNDFGLRILDESEGPEAGGAQPAKSKLYDASPLSSGLDEDTLLWIMCDALLVYVALDPSRVGGKKPGLTLDTCALLRDRRSLEDCRRLVGSLVEAIDVEAYQSGARNSLTGLNRCVRSALSARVLQVCMRSLLAIISPDALVKTYEQYVANVQRVIFALLGEGDTALSLRRGGVAALAQRLVCSCLRAAAPTQIVVLLRLRIEIAKQTTVDDGTLIAEMDEALAPFFNVEALSSCEDLNLNRNWTAAPPWLVTAAHGHSEPHVDALLTRGQDTMARATASAASNDENTTTTNGGLEDDIEAAFAYSQVIDVETGYGPWNLVPSCVPSSSTLQSTRESSVPSNKTCECAREPARNTRVAKLAEAWEALQNSDQRERIRLISLQDLQAITQHLRGEIPGRPMDVLQVAREIYIDGESPRVPASYKLFALAHEHTDHDAAAENDTFHRALADTLEVYSRLDYGKIASPTAGHFERPLRRGASASKLEVLIKSDAGRRWQRLAAAFAETKLKMRALQASPAFAAAALSELDEIDVAEPPVQTVGALDERIIPNCALPPSLCVLADMAQGYPMFGASSSSSNGLLIEETYFVHAREWRQKANAAGEEAPGSLVFSDGWVVSKRCASACFANVGLVPIYLGEAPLCCECGQGCASTCALDFSCGGGGGSSGSGSSNGRITAWLPELKLKSTLSPDGKRRLSCYVANFAPDITIKQRPSRRKKRGAAANGKAANGKASTFVSEATTKNKAKEDGQVQSIPSTSESALSGQETRNVVACAQPSQGRRGKRPLALQCNACGGDVKSNRCSGETRSETGTERTNDSIHSLFERILRLSQTGPALADELQHEVQCCKDLAQQYTARRDDVFSKGERLFNLQNILTYLEEIDAMHSKTSDLAKRHVQGRRGHSRSHDPPAQTSTKDLSAHSHFASCVNTLCETMSKVEQIPRSLLEVAMDSPMLSMRLQASLEACSKPSAPTKQVTGASVMIDHTGAEPSSGSPLAGGAGVLSAVMSLATSAGRAAREDARAEASALHEASVKEGALLAFCADFLGPLSRVSEEICVAAAVNPYEGLLATPRKGGDGKMSMEREKEGEEGEIAEASVDKQGDPGTTERWDDWRQEITSKLRETLEMHEVQTIAWKQEQFFAGRPGLELGQQEARRIAKTAGVFYPTPRMSLDLGLSEREAILDLVLAAAQVLVAVRQVQVAGKESAATAPLSDARMDDEEVTTKVQAIFKDQLVLVNNTVHLDAALSQQVQQNFTCEDDLCHVRELIISAQHRLRALKRDYEASLENLGAVERALRRNVTMRFQFFTAAIAQLLVNRVDEIAHQSAVNAKHRATLLNQVEPASLALGAGGGGGAKTRKAKSKRKTRGGKSVSEQEGARQETRSYSLNDTLGMTENGIGNSKDKEEEEEEPGTSSVLHDMKTSEQDVHLDDSPPSTQTSLEKDELSVDESLESWTTVSARRKGNRRIKTQHTDASADGQFQTQAKEKMESRRGSEKSTKRVSDRATPQVVGDVEKESLLLHSSCAAALTEEGRSKDDVSKQKSSDVAQSPKSELASKSSQKTSLADRESGDAQANGSTSQFSCSTEEGTRGDAVTQAPPDSNSSEAGAVSPAAAETSTKHDKKTHNRKKKNKKKSSKSKKLEAVSQSGVDKAAVDVSQSVVDKAAVDVSQNGVDKAAVHVSQHGVDKPTAAALDAWEARESSTPPASSTEEASEHALAPAPTPTSAPTQKSGVSALSNSEKAHEPTGTSEAAAGAKGNSPPVVDICRLFLQGNCPEGDACPRRHVTPVQLHDEMLAWAQGQTMASERLSGAPAVGQGESKASGPAGTDPEVGQSPPLQNFVTPEQSQPGPQFVQVGQHAGPPGNFWPPYMQAYMQNGMMPFAPSFHPPHPPPPQPMMHVPMGPMPGPSGHEMYYSTPYMMPGYPNPPPPFMPMPPQHPYYLHAMPPHATMMPMQEPHQHVEQQDKAQRDENEPTSPQKRSEAEE